MVYECIQSVGDVPHNVWDLAAMVGESSVTKMAGIIIKLWNQGWIGQVEINGMNHYCRVDYTYTEEVEYWEESEGVAKQPIPALPLIEDVFL